MSDLGSLSGYPDSEAKAMGVVATAPPICREKRCPQER
jgi:hypothetical protein